eukprot:gb/GEZN01005305.1/.p1 GENE.gb/GEZN01005305.1/~~gb/GEZN01005305.1/.p1  ORF type:complete len:569 (+),score=78.69 gb/GEZN01005305.1/:84-1790(+)
MSGMMRPRFLLLKEGTDTSQGKGQLLSNIAACEAITDILSTTLGPRGMDKLIWEGTSVTISNDGATIIDLLQIVHPAAKTLVDIAKSQDQEVGDGTTSVCLIAGELLKCIKGHVEDGMHPQVIIKGFQQACELALAKLKKLSIETDRKDPAKHLDMLTKCAATALNSKLIAAQRDFFSKIAVDAIMHLEEDMNLANVGIKLISGGSVTDSKFVEGVAFKKTFSYAGFEMAPKKFVDPKIALLNVELELKAERFNAEVRIKDPAQYQSIVDAEWNVIYTKLEKIVQCGANIVLSVLPIGDLATQYFADRKIFCAGRLTDEDMERVHMATGGQIQTSLEDLQTPGVLGTCGLFQEVQIGKSSGAPSATDISGGRYNLFTGCPKAKACTILLRGGTEQFLHETKRSLHDALMIVKRAKQHSSVVGGGGAIEMELSKYLRKVSRQVKSKRQLVISSFAQALEVIPRQIAANAGFDSTDIVNELRARHAAGGTWIGVDVESEGVCDTYEKFVWEPTLVKLNAISAATQAACLILSVDDTVRNPTAGDPNPNENMEMPENKYKRGKSLKTMMKE